jgi:NADP-dependent 3-hydroxy acid dehydrogenase YdfG
VAGIERWKGKVALVTGASSGIGVAIARALSGAGLKVALAARRQDRLESLAAELPGEALVAPTDLRDEQSVASLFARVRDAWGGVDVLVNNAGLGHKAPLLSGETERWREMLEVNVLGLCICTREAVSNMRARGDSGHVFHISSMSAHRVPHGSGVYSASKFAVRSLTEGLRLELRELNSAVRVTSISPGFVETEFAERYHQSAELGRETYSHYKVLEADDVAQALVYALGAPDHVQVHDLLMRPTAQPS